MNLQNAILKEFNSIFPNVPLREVSSLTGIQITRVFRLYNGSEMKLKEYEAFQLAISQKMLKATSSRFFENSKRCLDELSPQRLKEINSQIETALSLSQLRKINKYTSDQLAA